MNVFVREHVILIHKILYIAAAQRIKLRKRKMLRKRADVILNSEETHAADLFEFLICFHSHRHVSVILNNLTHKRMREKHNAPD